MPDQYRTVLVIGEKGSGKSSLINAAIFDLMRQTKLDSAEQEAPYQLPQNDAKIRVISPLNGFWAPHEINLIDHPKKLEQTSASMWLHWMNENKFAATNKNEEENTQSASLKVTVLHEQAFSTRPFPSPFSGYILVEASTNLFKKYTMNNTSASLTSQRLKTLIQSADTVVICIPVHKKLSEETYKTIMTIYHERLLARAKNGLKIILTHSDIEWLDAIHAYGTRAHNFPYLDIEQRKQYAIKLIENDKLKKKVLDGTKSLVHIDMCSSYGILINSGTPNVDLFSLNSTQPLTLSGSFPPLWPNVNDDTVAAYPLAIQNFENWKPVGVKEAIFI